MVFLDFSLQDGKIKGRDEKVKRNREEEKYSKAEKDGRRMREVIK